VFPAQANNAYVFPAVGHAAVLTRCRSIPDAVFLRAAEALAAMSSTQQLREGRLFPPFSEIRGVQARLCAELAAFMVQQGLGDPPASLQAGSSPADWLRVVQAHMFDPCRAAADEQQGPSSSPPPPPPPPPQQRQQLGPRVPAAAPAADAARSRL
jgi:malate dehydrogenase (oxaloacetate-decarboxylating)(NADP+)